VKDDPSVAIKATDKG